ncbi:hypothetical protein C8R44DRAFT_576675, partial [Mycena epipterygia]
RSDASAILDLMKKHELQQLVKAGTPTFYSAPHNTWSTLDLVFASKGVLADSLVKCWATPGDGSDHNAVRVIFNVAVVHHDAPLRHNFRATDWKDAIRELVPLSHPTPHTHCWWSRAILSLLRAAYCRAHRAIVKDDCEDPSWAAMRAAKNAYHSAIRQEKHTHWRSYVAD